MKRCTLNIVSVSLVLLTGITPAASQEKNQERLQGTWEIASIISPAKRKPFVAGMLVRFEDGQVSVLGRKAPPEVTVTFRLNPESTPKQMDIISKSKLPNGHPLGRELVITTKGIYEIKGDTLRTCAGPPNGERPETFDVSTGTATVLTTYKRLKEANRKWADSTGKYSTEASIEFVVDETVILRRTDRSLVRIPMARLSTADAEYARRWLREHVPASDDRPS